MSTQLQTVMLCHLGNHQLAYKPPSCFDMSVSCVLSYSAQKELPWYSLFSRQRRTLLVSSSLSSALFFSNGIPFPLITRASNQLGANGPFPSSQIHHISLTTLPQDTPCPVEINYWLLSHTFPYYPRSPCVNIYNFNINCFSSQLLPLLLLIYFRVIH